MMKSSGLSTDPWWTPTFTSNSSLYPSPTRTRLRAFAYIPCTSRTIHSSTPSFLSAHQMTFRGTQSNAFSRSTKAMYPIEDSDTIHSNIVDQQPVGRQSGSRELITLPVYLHILPHAREDILGRWSANEESVKAYSNDDERWYVMTDEDERKSVGCPNMAAEFVTSTRNHKNISKNHKWNACLTNSADLNVKAYQVVIKR